MGWTGTILLQRGASSSDIQPFLFFYFDIHFTKTIVELISEQHVGFLSLFDFGFRKMPLSHEFKDVEAQVARPAMNGTMLLVDSLAAVQRGAVRLSVLPSPRTVYDSRDQGFTVNFMNPLLPIGPPHSSNVSPPSY